LKFDKVYIRNYHVHHIAIYSFYYSASMHVSAVEFVTDLLFSTTKCMDCLGGIGYKTCNSCWIRHKICRLCWHI